MNKLQGSGKCPKFKWWVCGGIRIGPGGERQGTCRLPPASHPPERSRLHPRGAAAVGSYPNWLLGGLQYVCIYKKTSLQFIDIFPVPHPGADLGENKRPHI